MKTLVYLADMVTWFWVVALKLSTQYRTELTLTRRQIVCGVFAEIAWEPEKPTSYFISIFSIELQIIPELKKLIADTQIDWTKQQNGSKKQRIEDAIAAWKNTLKWASPIFSDENSFMKSKEVESLSSDNSIFGKLMKPKIEEAYGIYGIKRGTKLPGSDEAGVYPVKDDWDQMEKKLENYPERQISRGGRSKYQGWNFETYHQ